MLCNKVSTHDSYTGGPPHAKLPEIKPLVKQYFASKQPLPIDRT